MKIHEKPPANAQASDRTLHKRSKLLKPDPSIHFAGLGLLGALIAILDLGAWLALAD